MIDIASNRAASLLMSLSLGIRALDPAWVFVSHGLAMGMHLPVLIGSPMGTSFIGGLWVSMALALAAPVSLDFS